jgi:sugar lactone lactonase YvrE
LTGENGRIWLENIQAGRTDPGNQKADYTVSTFAGTMGSSGIVNGPPGIGALNGPLYVEVMNSSLGGDELAVASLTTASRVSPSGSITVFYTASGGGSIRDLHRADANHVWVLQTNHVLYRVNVDTGAVVQTVGLAGTSGNVNGSDTTARLSSPLHLGSGFLADLNGIRLFDPSSGQVGSVMGPVPSSTTDLVYTTSSGTWLGSYMAARGTANRLRSFDPATNIQMAFGTGTAGAANGLADVAQFSNPTGLAYGNNEVFVVDSGLHSIRRVTPLSNQAQGSGAGYFVSTLAGGNGNGTANGLGTVAQFNSPNDLAVDMASSGASGDIYVADTNNHVIRRITRVNRFQSLETALASTSAEPVSFPGAKFLPNPNGDLNPIFSAGASSVAFPVILPAGVDAFVADVYLATDPDYPAGLNAVVNPVGTDVVGSPRTAVVTIAGRVGAPGYADGYGAAAAFGSETAVATDHSGRVFVADKTNGVIRRRANDGRFVTIIGAPFSTTTSPVNGDGTVEAGVPHDLAVSVDGKTIWWTDSLNHVVRRAVYNAAAGLDEEKPQAWNVTTLYGSAGVSGDAVGAGATARFNAPQGIAVDHQSGMVYICDTGNHRIKRFASTLGGALATLAGSGAAGSANGTGTSAQFNSPRDVAVSPTGDIFVADTLNRTIRKITPNGVVSLLAGQTGAGFLQDGVTGPASRFHTPTGVAVDTSGYVFVVDGRVGRVIRRVSPTGQVATAAGQSVTSTAADGPGDQAVFLGANMSLAPLPGGELIAANEGIIREIHHVVLGR